jgi:hypothetical protein
MNMSTKGKIFSLILFFILLLGCVLARYEPHLAIANAGSPCPLRTDVNGDGVANILDISMIGAAWGSYPGHPKWNAKLDLNDDNTVNIIDMVLVLKDFGKKWLCYDFDGSLDRNVWNVASGSWDTFDGWLEGTANSEGLVYVRNMTWKDFTLSANVKIAADSLQAEAALCFLFVDPWNYYWAGLGCWGHKVSISRMVNSVPEELVFDGDRKDITKENWYNLSIRVSANTIALYVNDKLELTTDVLIFSNGVVGIRTWNSHILIDDVTVSGFASTNVPSVPTVTCGGLNFLSLYHDYSQEFTTNEELRRDFDLFRNNNISIIAVNMYWYKIETERGIYNDVFLENIKRVCRTAAEHGLQVLLTVHTLWGDADSLWCTPDYVIDPESGVNVGSAVVRSEDMKQAFLDMFEHTVRYLAGTPGVWAWAILNEPSYWGRTPDEYDFVTQNGKTQRENFLDIIARQSAIVKAYDSRSLVTIRFVNTEIFERDWNYDPIVFNNLDFIGLNAYIPLATDASFSEVDAITRKNVEGCYRHGKKVWITEFGASESNDEVLRQVYEHAMEYYVGLGVQGAIAWFWMSDVAPSGYTQVPAFGGFNLANPDGTARLAFYEMQSTIRNHVTEISGT